MPAEPTLRDAIYGSLVGGAAGDALGAPTEGMYYTDIQEKYGRLDTMIGNTTTYTNQKPGSITDDSVWRHYLCVAILEKGDRITPQDVERTVLNQLNPDRLWVNESIVLERLKAGISPFESGEGGIMCGCSTMGISPVGIINLLDPERAFLDGYLVARVNSSGEECEFAGAFAAAQAAAFEPGMTFDRLLETTRKHSTQIVQRAIDMTMDLVVSCDGVQEYKERFYTSLLDWTWPMREWAVHKNFCGYSREIIPVVFAILHYCWNDPDAAIIEGANFGRDCDTIASLVGTILGTVHGGTAIRADWRDLCERANADFFAELLGDPTKGFEWMAAELEKAVVGRLQRDEIRHQERLRRAETRVG